MRLHCRLFTFVDRLIHFAAHRKASPPVSFHRIHLVRRLFHANVTLHLSWSALREDLEFQIYMASLTPLSHKRSFTHSKELCSKELFGNAVQFPVNTMLCVPKRNKILSLSICDNIANDYEQSFFSTLAVFFCVTCHLDGLNKRGTICSPILHGRQRRKKTNL